MQHDLHKYAIKMYNYSYVILGGIDMTVKVGIVGVTGYAGGELIRLLLNHPQAEIVAASSRSNVGNPVSAVHKQFYGYMDLIECEMNAENFAECDVVFLALPHGASSGLAKELVSMGKKVIDLGADMRLRDYGIRFDALCEDLGVERSEVEATLATIDYYYNEEQNRFV